MRCWRWTRSAADLTKCQSASCALTRAKPSCGLAVSHRVAACRAHSQRTRTRRLRPPSSHRRWRLRAQPARTATSSCACSPRASSSLTVCRSSKVKWRASEGVRDTYDLRFSTDARKHQHARVVDSIYTRNDFPGQMKRNENEAPFLAFFSFDPFPFCLASSPVGFAIWQQHDTPPAPFSDYYSTTHCTRRSLPCTQTAPSSLFFTRH
mmetsp:Transcript_12193/g.28243  ORF Transcript_12193/g.28243 Transcript_12193/m.28243 type:complete len:208 (+) Transcript_12193:1015-1638(+)